jgi:hypothetical protein
VSRLVDRGAIVAAYVGIGVAITLALSFLLIIPIEPIYWYLAVPAGLLVGYYANARSGRGAGAWGRFVANSLVAGVATGLTMGALLLGVKALFFAADDGYRDAGQGGRIQCQTGADCVYRRYAEVKGDALRGLGVTDAASFSSLYWSQQWTTAGVLLGLATASAVVGGLMYGATRPRAGRAIAPEPGA